ncbi:MAG: type I-E CRISPR-associated protein Cse2/CasB, partial [Synergistaceae bacterium]|nr:type I-E CRISPR-associated protein Cse2/CasB [Synergistaceae bacterium]
MLANIRRGVGKSPGEIPELWGLIFNNMPEELLGTRGASPAEWAVYTALTLYALHQQGNEKFMNVEDVSVGKAASMLVKNDEDEDRIRRRLGLVVTATSPSDLAYHLRGVIQLLSRDAIGLDYALLARD